MSRFLVRSLLAAAPGRFARLVSVLGFLMGLSAPAMADLTYSLTTDSLGNSASASFKLVGGGIEVSVTNTESAATFGSTNAISQVQIAINPASLGLATAFTELSGDEVDYSGSTAGTDLGFKDFKLPSTDPNLHWAFSTSGSTVINLFDVGTGGVGGQPREMIAPRDGIAKNTGVGNFDPYFNGTANFFLALPDLPNILTTADITGVSFSFGTNPGSTGEESLVPSKGSGTSTPASVPEPGSVAMILIGGAMTAG